MRASFKTRCFDFKFPAGTSRGVLHQKISSFLILESEGKTGIGECSTIPGLSPDPEENYLSKLEDICAEINQGKKTEELDLKEYPSIAFGLESALLDLKTGANQILFPSAFTKGEAGIPINGLIWMGDKAFMQKQIQTKLDDGYRCLKLKVGALDFDTELQILTRIREKFSPDELEIRLDANGAFLPENVQFKLEMLSAFSIHSIEQPIRQGQHQLMAELCKDTPIPIALDEELISFNPTGAVEFLNFIQPAYIILKPSLLGGFKISQQWIDAAKQSQTGWWITSALESNIGLNAIAQWTFTLNNRMPQGLGTGQLYHNNIDSPLEIRGAELWYKT